MLMKNYILLRNIFIIFIILFIFKQLPTFNFSENSFFATFSESRNQTFSHCGDDLFEATQRRKARND